MIVVDIASVFTISSFLLFCRRGLGAFFRKERSKLVSPITDALGVKEDCSVLLRKIMDRSEDVNKFVDDMLSGSEIASKSIMIDSELRAQDIVEAELERFCNVFSSDVSEFDLRMAQVSCDVAEDVAKILVRRLIECADGGVSSGYFSSVLMDRVCR